MHRRKHIRTDAHHAHEVRDARRHAHLHSLPRHATPHAIRPYKWCNTHNHAVDYVAQGSRTRRHTCTSLKCFSCCVSYARHSPNMRKPWSRNANGSLRAANARHASQQ